jgi:hypothetical protein
LNNEHQECQHPSGFLNLGTVGRSRNSRLFKSPYTTLVRSRQPPVIR